MDYLTLIVNLVNMLASFAFSYILYTTYREKKRKFYLYWFYGFLAYGVSNLIHTIIWMTGQESSSSMLVLGVCALTGFTAFLVGLGELRHKIRLYLSLAMCIPLITGVLFLMGAPVLAFSIFFLMPYAIITMMLIILSLKFKINMNILILGWLLILTANMGLATRLLSIQVAPLFSLMGKSLMFYWMTRPFFSTFAESFDAFITKPVAEPVLVGERYITMIESSTEFDTLGWVKEYSVNETNSGLKTIIFLTEENSEPVDYSELLSIPSVYLFRITDGYRKSGPVFSQRVMDISNDVSEINVLIYDILEYIRVNEVSIQIFFYDVSFFIKRNGWRRVYSQMISLIPQFKAENIRVFFIYNGDLLENRYIVEIVRHLADNVIKLGD